MKKVTRFLMFVLSKLKSLLSLAAPLTPWRSLRQMTGLKLFLPFYHLVSDENPAHIKHLYPVKTVKQFEADLDFILKYYRPVALWQVQQAVFEQKHFQQPVFHLSFDDGLRECYDVIMPILLRKGIPATFFLNPAFIDNKALMYRYKASLLCELAPAQRTAFLGARYANQHLLDSKAQELGYSYEDFLRTQRPYMSLAQISEMQKQGFSFGAHSLDHPQYNQLAPAEQHRQTQESLAQIQTLLQVQSPCFAFPFTDDGVQLAHYQAFPNTLFFGGAGVKYDTPANSLQRFPMEKTMQSAHTLIATEYLYYLLKMPFGKNRIQR